MELTKISQPPDSRKASRLVSLPLEILTNVASNVRSTASRAQSKIALITMTQLYRPSYLSKFSRACREIRSAIQPVFYRDFSINLRRDWSALRWLDSLLDEEASGLKYTTRFSVLTIPDFLGEASATHPKPCPLLSAIYFQGSGLQVVSFGCAFPAQLIQQCDTSSGSFLFGACPRQ